MEHNKGMMGQIFTDKNDKFDKGEYLKIYTWFRQVQVAYTRR